MIVARGFRYTITVDGLQPADDPAWRNAPARVRNAFWAYAVDIVLAAKDAEVAAGLDCHGRPFIPISERTRKHRVSWMGWADPAAPPLTPTHVESRTRALLRARQSTGRITLYWLRDPESGKTWGKILDMHRRGKGRYGRIPVRDTFGLSPAARRSIEKSLARWWSRRLAGQLDDLVVVDHPSALARKGPTPPAKPAEKIPLRRPWSPPAGFGFVARGVEAKTRTYLTPEPAAGSPAPLETSGWGQLRRIPRGTKR
jgi:hypothetical protein